MGLAVGIGRHFIVGGAALDQVDIAEAGQGLHIPVIAVGQTRSQQRLILHNGAPGIARTLIIDFDIFAVGCGGIIRSADESDRFAAYQKRVVNDLIDVIQNQIFTFGRFDVTRAIQRILLAELRRIGRVARGSGCPGILIGVHRSHQPFLIVPSNGGYGCHTSQHHGQNHNH